METTALILHNQYSTLILRRKRLAKTREAGWSENQTMMDHEHDLSDSPKSPLVVAPNDGIPAMMFNTAWLCLPPFVMQAIFAPVLPALKPY